MIVTLREVLSDAQKNKYAVGLFNTVNLEMARGVLAAAEETNSPVIIGTAEVLLPFGPMEELSYFLVPMAQKARVPVVLHYDHGLTPALVIKAMTLGFSSVMYDCSTVGYEENIRRCKEMSAIAKLFGASIEAELGHVGANENAAEETARSFDQSGYTNPRQAKEFAEQTNVDALAVAIGTAHGAYKSKPKLDIGRLKEIAQAVSIPLVLHGGSGLSDEDFRNCVANGISKVNIFTDINQAAAKAAGAPRAADAGMTEIIPDIVERVRQAAMEKMRLFGCTGKG